MTLKEKDAVQMTDEIQKMLNIEGLNEIKSINLGIILARYIGIELLESTVEETKEYISNLNVNNLEEINSKVDSEIDILIEKFK